MHPNTPVLQDNMSTSMAKPKLGDFETSNPSLIVISKNTIDPHLASIP